MVAHDYASNERKLQSWHVCGRPVAPVWRECCWFMCSHDLHISTFQAPFIHFWYYVCDFSFLSAFFFALDEWRASTTHKVIAAFHSKETIFNEWMLSTLAYRCIEFTSLQIYFSLVEYLNSILSNIISFWCCSSKKKLTHQNHHAFYFILFYFIHSYFKGAEHFNAMENPIRCGPITWIF